MKSASHLVAALLAIALLGIGCGDDDEETAETTTGATGISGEAETREQFVATANEVCANAEREILRAAEEQGIGETSSPQEVRQFTETIVVPIQQSVVDSLHALSVPEAEEDQVARILDSLQGAIDRIESDPDLLRDAEGAADEFEQANALAEDYGITECSE
jgi:hypothetical protein